MTAHVAIAAQPGVIFCSFGDMLRVPGSVKDLFQVKSEGGDVRIVYSPLDAVKLAIKNPDKQVVFFGVGFETTAPANAMSVHLAKMQGLKNFSMLVSHVLVPPAIESHHAIGEQPRAGISGRGPRLQRDGLLAVSPPWPRNIACRLSSPALSRSTSWKDCGAPSCNSKKARARVENAYERVVTFEGNREAQRLLGEVFEVCDRAWRGIGVIPASGWRLSAAYRDFDAELRFAVTGIHAVESPLCHSGEVLRGALKPNEWSGLRQAMHAAPPARRYDGFQRRRLRCLLQTTGASFR